VGVNIFKISGGQVSCAPAPDAPKVDPLAQSVEHNTFNVGVLGSFAASLYYPFGTIEVVPAWKWLMDSIALICFNIVLNHIYT